MLITFVAVYLFVTVAIGLWAARRVHNSRDYVVAGRIVPLFMSTALVFAPEALIPPQLVGMAFSFLGMFVGSLYGRQTPRPHAAHPRGH